MPRYKCARCGTESPHDKSCFVCGGSKTELSATVRFDKQKEKRKKKIERHRHS